MSVTVAMAPNSKIKLKLPPSAPSGGRWSLQDSDLGTLTDGPDGSKYYQHGNKIGIQKITYTAPDGSYAICNVVTIVPHDHSDMFRGGPAFGVYKTE